MKTPQSASVNVQKLSSDLLNKLNRSAPVKAKPTPETKATKKWKDDKGSTTAKDKLSSLTHMLDSIDFNMNHGYNHVLEAKIHTEKAIDHIKKSPELQVSYGTLFDRISKIHNKLKKVTE